MKIWIVDDDGSFVEVFQRVFPNLSPIHYTNGKELLQALQEEKPDFIFVDLNFDRISKELLLSRLPSQEGIVIARRIKKKFPDMKIMLVSRFGTGEVVAEARAIGIPFLDSYSSDQVVKKTIEEFLGLKKAANLNALQGKLASVGYYTASPQVLNEIIKIPLTPTNKGPILILGPTGSGKTELARALHSLIRQAKPFLHINIVTIPPELITSELFGHEKGAFTGATHAHPGLFERANGGTVFLDEIGDLPFSDQTKLLVFLETSKFTRLGGTREIKVDVLTIAATSKNPKEKIKQELYWRFPYIIHLPPLEKRPEDIEIYLQKAAPEKFSLQFTEPAIEFLKKQKYPGNYRTLERLIKTIKEKYKEKNHKTELRIGLQEVADARFWKELHHTPTLAISLQEQNLYEALTEKIKKDPRGLEGLETDLINYLLCEKKMKPHEVANLLKISPATIYRKYKKK